MTKTDGGSAFPKPYIPMPSGDPVSYRDGMTLRDYFAGQALISVIHQAPVPLTVDTCMAIAFDAYAVADAMLAERVK